MQISVVIPAYNAADFIEEAIRSACAQEETAEVIVVDDGSTDETLAICLALSTEIPILVVLQHPDKQNHGAGPTRNVGIEAAQYPFIAFLDGDDVFLPRRFAETKKVFEKYPDADGVYECLGIRFSDAEVKTQWYKRFNYSNTTLRSVVPPEELIFSMAPLGDKGWFSGDALTVKKEIFQKCGLYSDLRLSQDTELFMKMAITSRLYPGNIETPVAERRVHAHNRITTSPAHFYANRVLFWRRMIRWMRAHAVQKKIRSASYRQYRLHVLKAIKYSKQFSGKLQYTAVFVRHILSFGYLL
ncbi:MAG: glycosyltransferase family A protein [Chitinophagales bacterium]